MRGNKDPNLNYDIGYLKARVEELSTRVNWLYGIVSALVVYSLKSHFLT